MINMTKDDPDPLTKPVRDFATEAGTYVIEDTTVGHYLDMLKLYDPNSNAASWDESLYASFQRATLAIEKNPNKRRMLRDMMRGGTLPPIVLYDGGDEERPQIVDGLQRTHVLTEGLKVLQTLERGEEMKDKFAKEEIEAMKALEQSPIGVSGYLERPVVLQVWRDLLPDELVRLFMVLNVGQQKVSPRHLMEVVGSDVRGMFEEWGLKLLTEREEKQQPRKRGRRRKISDVEASLTGSGLTHFRYEYLLDGLFAYVTRDPQVKTSTLLQDKIQDTPNLALEERVTEIGSEFCKSDFVWVCHDLNDFLHSRYKNSPKWSVAIQNSDNFFIPLMAALGNARSKERAKVALEDRKRKLIEILRPSDDEDPLDLLGVAADSLETIQASIRSNIGRKQRGVVYTAWVRYFMRGPEDPSHPIDWRDALVSE